ncbi:MAG TPA: endospore germination permease [Desulfobacteria bacterium]|nr:endospore germination permease [Desulfobacteria bacterium]
MQQNEAINTKQFIWLLFTVLTSISFMQLPAIIIFNAGREAWLAVMLAWLLDVLLAVVYAYMGIRFPGENFVQYAKTIFGRYVGSLIGLMFIALFGVTCVVLERGVAQLINIVFLPKTPLGIILISGFVVIAVAAKKGIEVIGRTVELLGPIYLASIILLAILLVPDVRLERLTPQFSTGYTDFLPAAVIMLSFIGICIMMGMLQPICNRPENAFLSKFAAVTLGVGVVQTIIFLSITIFGDKLAANMYAPSLQLTRIVHIGKFIERVEVVWMVITISAGIMSSAILLWAVSVGISQVFGLLSDRPLVYPLAFLTLVLCFFSFDSNVMQSQFTHYTLPVLGIFVESFLEMLLFFAALITGKRGRFRQNNN